NDRVDLPLCQPVPQVVRAVALVTRDGIGPHPLQALLQQRDGLRALVALPRRQGTDDRLAAALGHQVQLAAPAPAAAPELLVGDAPFFGAPAAWWWARMLLPSIIAREPSISPSCAP